MPFFSSLPPSCRLGFRFALLVLAAGLTDIADAASTAPASDPAEGALLQQVLLFAERETGGLDGKVVIDVPPLDARTRTGACAAPQVFIPPGARLWGRSHVGVRCASPAWLIYVPVVVKVTGSYLRSTRKLTAGQPLGEADFSVEQGDLTQLPDGVLTAATQALGQRTRSGLDAGLPLRRDLLVRTPAIRQGQTVKLVVRGTGFSVSSSGLALTNGYEGEVIRVKSDTGRTMQGRVLPSGIVEVTQ